MVAEAKAGRSTKRAGKPAARAGRKGRRTPRKPRPETHADAPRRPISHEAWVRVARTLKALAHPERLRIIDLLETGERSVGDIVHALGAKAAVTSQQLGLMRDRGILDARREGNHVYYRIANPNVVQVIHCIRRSCRANEPNESADA